jgi:hypothetical protein
MTGGAPNLSEPNLGSITFYQDIDIIPDLLGRSYSDSADWFERCLWSLVYAIALVGVLIGVTLELFRLCYQACTRVVPRLPSYIRAHGIIRFLYLFNPALVEEYHRYLIVRCAEWKHDYGWLPAKVLAFSCFIWWIISEYLDLVTTPIVAVVSWIRRVR